MVQDFAKKRTTTVPGKIPAPSAPANRTLLFTGLITGLALGIFISFLVYLSGVLPTLGQPSSLQAEIQTEAQEREQVQAQQKLSEDLERAAARLQLEFYQELPNYEVIVSTIPVDPSIARRQSQLRPNDVSARPENTSSDSASRADILTQVIAELTGEPGVAAESTVADSSSGTTASTTANPQAQESRLNGVSYMIQAGAFQQESAAVLQSNRLVGLGLDARVKKEALLGKTLFLVQAGPYRSREQLSQVERILRTNSIDSMRITLGSQ